MMMVERFEIALNTPAGRLTTALDVPTGFVPITAIVPVTRRLGEEALQLEELRARKAGQSISCRMGCAACCRMLVPVSPPEAFALRDYVEQLPADRREKLASRLAETRASLETNTLWDRLQAVAEATEPVPDEDLEPLNRAYYALRLPCPFLENEMCAIYETRPAACRELLVTSPADLCRDMVGNPVRPLPPPVRIGTVLGLVWAGLTNSAPRLIPLPLALDWAEQHRQESTQTWTGSALIDQMLDKMWRFLSQEFMNRSKTGG
jgi:Fe-S-cluster containining protein